MFLRIGTRGSRLALKQTKEVEDLIYSLFPEARLKRVVIKTTGDKMFEHPLHQLPGKGHFIKEIENALLEGEIDIAVHSLKDLPTELAPGLTLGAVPKRLEPADVLISRTGQMLEALPYGAKIGTSSLRRQAQILSVRPDLKVVQLRGNLDTRLHRLREGFVDAIIVAEAGLRRLGISGLRMERLPYCIMLPAAGQGALGLETREGELEKIITELNHPESYAEAVAERSLLRHLGGGCHTPIGCLARAGKDGELYLEAMVCNPDGSGRLRAFLTGSISEAAELGKRLAKQLIEGGADKIIKTLARDGEHNDDR
ncbi:hydroxymethylbilane synthase [Candidatus Sumerlaeota bacterium]|nr:hydroxymethylbilane synthase [Candidatus Sumerlaeota bacterium]